MKLTIKGHPTRGKEVIQILESLGGKNTSNHKGKDNYAYYISSIDSRIYKTSLLFSEYRHYTLEEFEREFPFKIGDKIKHITSIGIIKEYCYINNEPAYKVESMELGIIATIPSKILEPYKEMERNVTLTLEKAKEWYNKGGELKEIALQAFTEKELNPLPRSWEEFCDKYSKTNDKEYFIDAYSNIEQINAVTLNHCRLMDSDRNLCPSKKSAEAHLAMIQLEQLRDCWLNGWEPIWDISYKYCIKYYGGELNVVRNSAMSEFLTFPTKEMAKEFLKCFRELIELAGDLI